MIIGTGIDIVELNRVSKVMNRQISFVKRILTEKEREIFSNLSEKRKVEFLAGRFAAKEAFAKAVGTGIGKNLSWQDIEILKDDVGKPKIFSVTDYGFVHISISHSKDYAIANVIIEGKQ